ncbi:MAG: hypothetical protein RL662_1907 [Bacteroidota bacterium]|jgi:uncharacterized membrane protein
MDLKKYILNNSYLASKGIAGAVLVCLGIGLLIQTTGQLLHWAWLVNIGMVTKTLFIPALGVGIAIVLGAKMNVVLSAGAVAIIGGGGTIVSSSGTLGIAGGEPIGAICAALAAIWVGKRVSGTNPFDMILTPLVAVLVGGVVGTLSNYVIMPVLVACSEAITSMVSGYPLLSSVVIALVFALLILSPASSAALAIALNLDATASAAALIGCAVQFTCFAVLGWKQNSVGAFFGQFICTPKLQTPNIIQKPRIVIIPLFIAAIMSPIGILLLDIESTKEVAGLGLCAFVAPLYIVSYSGVGMLMSFVSVVVLIPSALAVILQSLFIRLGFSASDDYRIDE